MTQLIGRTASITGRNHINFLVNDPGSGLPHPLTIASLGSCQDAIATQFVTNGNTLDVSFVLHDGSSDGRYSESAAHLLAEPAAIELARAISQHGIESADVESHMYTWYIANMHKLIAVHPYGEFYLAALQMAQSGRETDVDKDYRLSTVHNWIKNHLQFTVVMGYFSPKGLRTLIRGDGGFMIDDRLVVNNFDNVAPYLAYIFYSQGKIQKGIAALVDDGHKVVSPPPGFDSNFYPNAKQVAAFTDGMPTGKLNEVWDLLDPIQDWDKKRNRLQTRFRSYWQEYINPNLPSDGWLIADDASVHAYAYA